MFAKKLQDMAKSRDAGLEILSYSAVCKTSSYFEQQIASFAWRCAAVCPRGGECHICAIRRRAADQGILFGLQIRDRASFFEPDSKTVCKICTITPSQGEKSQYCLAPSHWF